MERVCKLELDHFGFELDRPLDVAADPADAMFVGHYRRPLLIDRST